MSDDLLPILTRFHREVVLPDIQRVVAEVTSARFDDIDRHFDEIYKRFDRLETEYHPYALPVHPCRTVPAVVLDRGRPRIP